MPREKISRKVLQSIKDDYVRALNLEITNTRPFAIFRRSDIVAQGVLFDLSRDRTSYSVCYCAYVLAEFGHDRGIQVRAQSPSPRFDNPSLATHRRSFDAIIADALEYIRPKLNEPLKVEDFIPYCYGVDLKWRRVRANIALASLHAWLGRKAEAIEALDKAASYGADGDKFELEDWARFRPFAEELRRRIDQTDLRDWLMDLADARMSEQESR